MRAHLQVWPPVWEGGQAPVQNSEGNYGDLPILFPYRVEQWRSDMKGHDAMKTQLKAPKSRFGMFLDFRCVFMAFYLP